MHSRCEQYANNRLTKERMKEFPTYNIKSSISIFWLGTCGLITIIGTILLVVSASNLWTILISLLLNSFLPFYLIWTLTSKIKIDNEIIESTSAFHRTKYKLSDIKSFGVFSRVGRFASIMVDPDNVGQGKILSDNHIFLSTKTDFNPNNFKRSDTLTFQYRKDIYDDIKAILK